VIPLFGNTHTAKSYTGKQTTLLREEARAIIKRVTNCHISKGNMKDKLIFTGSGSTQVRWEKGKRGNKGKRWTRKEL
jgi:hypothetical protein